MSAYGILIISHGSRDPEWVRQVDEAVAGAHLPEGVPVSSCFLEIVEGRLIEDGVRLLEEQGVTDILAVPLFISSGSSHVDEIAYALRVVPEPATETDLTPLPLKARVHYGSPLDGGAFLARMVYDKIKSLSRDPGRETVLVVGHGAAEPDFLVRYRATLQHVAEDVAELGGFAGAEWATLLPDVLGAKLQALREREPEKAVLVAPLFLSGGYFTRSVVPSRLKEFRAREAGKASPEEFESADRSVVEGDDALPQVGFELRDHSAREADEALPSVGFECRYSGEPLLPHPLVSRWIEEQAALLMERN